MYIKNAIAIVVLLLSLVYVYFLRKYCYIGAYSFPNFVEKKRLLRKKT